jgi:AcrR family transcriptional regulator
VGSAEPPVVDRELGFVQHSAARTRVLDAALDLFAQHGVSGTSLQMIADAVGITKAAVYHQFRTKDNIVLAVTERELFRLAPALDAAEAYGAHGDELAARDELLVRVIEMAVRDRRLVRTLQFDPVVVRLLAEHEAFQPGATGRPGRRRADRGRDALGGNQHRGHASAGRRYR